MRTGPIFMTALLAWACGPADEPSGQPGTGGASSGATSTGAAGAAGSSTSASSSTTGAAGTPTTTSTTTGAAGSGGSGGAAGAGGSGGSGGSASGDDGGTDAGASDSGAPPFDAPRDVVADSPSRSRQIARPITMPYAKNGYWEYLPPGYGDGTKRPLLTFWHGVGENGAGTAGTELNKVLAHGPPKIIQNNQWTSDRPFVVLSVQHAGTGCPTADEVHDFITFALGNYDVDPKRVYLTGLSCGARGSWAYLGKYKGEQVVAAALIAGDSSAAYNAAGCSLLDTVGIWCFHGGADNPAADSAGMANFMACSMPHKDAKYDLFPNVDHQGSWERVYDDRARLEMVLSWMLGQTK